MKKSISFLLSMALLLMCIPMVAFAETVEDTEISGEESETELTNVALNENALAYGTSEKNTLWTPVVAIRDGQTSQDTWQGWECRYPDIIYGSDTSKGFSGEYCGIKFLNKEYYEIHKININLGLHAAMGGQNTHYTVQCLVEGVWVTVADFYDSDTTPVVTNSDGSLKFSSYEDAMANDTSFYHIGSEISIELEQPVTTNNVRVNVSEFAKNYPGGDVLIFPYIYEVELIGRLGETPDLELPEGAVVSTNAGYHSYPEASSSASYRYPYNAIDGKPTTYWSPKVREAGESLSLVFTEAKKINSVLLNFGQYQDKMDITDYKFDIEALIDGEWVVLGSGTSFDEENETLITQYSFDEVETNAIRVKFIEGFRKAPTVYEFEAHLSVDKTYYVEDRYDVNQRSSASKGNIAIIGTPYANRDFLPYSDVNYIIDGKIDKDAYVWFTGVIDMPSYCGIKFNEKQLIDRVALYFHVPDEEGIDIMSIQIQALIDGEYVTIIETKSYHEELKYSPAFKFDPIETDDIRVLYTAGNGTFANMKEIEIYSPNGGLPMFNGLGAMADAPEFLDYTTPQAEENIEEVEVENVAGNEIIEELEVKANVENIAEEKLSVQHLVHMGADVENKTLEKVSTANVVAVEEEISVAPIIVTIALCVVAFGIIAFVCYKRRNER